MKYSVVMGVCICLNVLSGSIDPDTFKETKHTQSKQIVKFNKNTNGHKVYYGREGVLRLPVKKVVR